MAHEDNGSAGEGRFKIEIGNAEFEMASVSFDDQFIVGAQVAEAAGAHPIEDFAILQHLKSGELESIRPTESVDLGRAGVERFFVVKGSSNHRFTVEGLNMEWPQNKLAAKHIKLLANADDDMVLVLDREDGDRKLSDDELVDLSEDGVERFKLHKKADYDGTVIWVNQDEHAFDKDKISYDEVVAFYLNDGGTASNQYLIKYSKGPSSNVSGTLMPGNKVKVKDGMRFRVSGTGES